MKSRTLILGVAAVAATLGPPHVAMAQTPSATSSSANPIKGPVTELRVVSLNGKVTAIDPVKRQVSVTGDDGGVATLFVGPEIRNFENLKVGDHVTASYTEAHSLAIAKGEKGNEAKLGELRMKIESQAANQAPAGGKPGLSAMQRTTMVANVFQIDRDRGILTLRGTSGVPVDVHVPDKEMLNQIGINDQLVVGYRHASVVSIQPGAPHGKPSSPASGARGASAPAR